MVPNKINKEKLKLNKSHSNGALNKSLVKSAAVETTTATTAATTNDLVTTEDEEANGKQMVGGCCVCADDTGYFNNLLVYCDGCDVAVHQGCYGIINVPEGDWFCRRCEHLQKNAELSANQVCCQLCATTDGAIKRTDNGKWAHVVCALFIPEISFGSNRSMEPIIMKDIMPDRLNKRCSICEMSTSDSNELNNSLNSSGVSDSTENRTGNKRTGQSDHAYVNCNKGGCKHWFHVTCAQAKGLLCEDHSVSQNNVTYCIYCKHHFSKLTSSDIKRIPPLKSQASMPTTTPNSTPKPKPAAKQVTKRKSLKDTSITPPLTTTPVVAATDKQAKKTKTSSSDNEVPVNSKKMTAELPVDSSVASPTKTARASRSNSLNNSPSEPEKSAKKSKNITPSTTTQTTTTTKLNIKTEADTVTNKQPQTPKQSPHALNLDSIKKEKKVPNLVESQLDPSTQTGNGTSLLIQIADASALAVETVIENIGVSIKSTDLNCNESEAAPKRKRSAEITDEQLSNQINTPSSSYSSSSSTYSIKSPANQKRQRKVTHLDMSNANSATTTNTTSRDV